MSPYPETSGYGLIPCFRADVLLTVQQQGDFKSLIRIFNPGEAVIFVRSAEDRGNADPLPVSDFGGKEGPVGSLPDGSFIAVADLDDQDRGTCHGKTDGDETLL